MLLSLLQTVCVRIFRLLTGFLNLLNYFFFADAPSINQNRNPFKQFFFIPLLREVSKLACSITRTHYKTSMLWHVYTLILFTSAKVSLDHRPPNIFSQSNAPCVLLSLMPTLTHYFFNGQSQFLSFFLHFNSFVLPLATYSIKFKPTIFEDG